MSVGSSKSSLILVTGGSGQVGTALSLAEWPPSVSVDFPSSTEMNLADPASIGGVFQRKRYAAVINCAAYTAVDDAEDHVERAFLVNAVGPAALADATRTLGIPLVQVSTDYVFDGAGEEPYPEDAAVGPLNVYGASKLAGEYAALKGCPRTVVVRTGWVVSEHGRNFVKSMLRLAENRPCLRVVGDQRGAPTSATDLADALRHIALTMIADRYAPTGIYHFANAGETSWAGVATETLRVSAAAGGLTALVEPISTQDYPTRARRPRYSVLSCNKLARDYGVVGRPWEAGVGEIVTRLLQRRSI